MKKYILIVIVALAAVCCTEQKIETYSGGHYLAFLNNGKTDSTLVSFFFYPGKDQLEVPLVLTLGGGPLAEDHTYELEVVADQTDALPKTYKLPTFVFRKGLVQDTAKIVLIKSDELSTGLYNLVLKIRQNDFFQFGQSEYRTARVVYTSKGTQPGWWDDVVIKSYLGPYTDTKYTHFLIATDGEGVNFNEVDSDGKRELALKFLYYLRKHKEDNDPIMDENGSEMKIPVVG